MNSFEAAAFFGLLFLCIALHNANKICTTLISLMAFNVVLYENIVEIKLSSQSFSHTFQRYCCPAQLIKEVRASSAYKWVIFDYKITFFFLGDTFIQSISFLLTVYTLLQRDSLTI